MSGAGDFSRGHFDEPCQDPSFVWKLDMVQVSPYQARDEAVMRDGYAYHGSVHLEGV